jgi:CheY-like chemotaxis protein
MILIVDDQRDAACLLTRVLRLRGQESVVVQSGAEALAVLEETHPSLVVLDVNMPVMDGIEVLAQIKADAATADLPVVMYSADPNADQIAKARRLGARDYVIKGTMTLHALADRLCALAH